ncbi:lipopolysaccharide assembly protein LapA domain-containing protein [Embleya sp. NBC_00896]|uniref:lipopolysaccharide assembly protein LapA domain-containing protein n=1 Tax=Embleya sp. NBC_00896 TaxID=2975961 RepID=UPI00386BDBF5|nr:LapA family protein [Embleya sp. NBC_00896]
MAKTSKSGAGGGNVGGVSYRTLCIAAIVVLSVWFVLANTKSATIRFWIPTLAAPMWIVLIGAFAAGALTGWWVKGNRR